MNRTTAVLIAAVLCAGDAQAQPGVMWDLRQASTSPCRISGITA